MDIHANRISKKYAALLSVIALVCTLISSVVYWISKGRIDAVAQNYQRQLLTEVVPARYFDNDILASCQALNLPEQPTINKIYTAKQGDKISAYAIQSTAPDGYSGNIVLLTGITPEGEVLGVRTLEHHETPGLGDKIELRISDWILSFNNKLFRPNEAEKWAVKKDGGEFDQFSGATITPRAVVNNVKINAQWVVSALAKNPALIQTASHCEKQ